jgi:hypothetical protein
MAGLIENMVQALRGTLPAFDSAKAAAKRRLIDMLANPGGYAEMVDDQLGNYNRAVQPVAQGGSLYNRPLTEDEKQQRATDIALNVGPMGVGIVSPQAARSLKFTPKLPDDDIFRTAVSNTPGASIADDGLLMALQRNQLPSQAMEPSVRGGVFYLPEGAAQGKHYSTGKNGYGGGEKITGETLVQNPLFAKGGTGGKAPESAFDQLAGKGAYQNMRTDALSSMGGYNASFGDKVANVRGFLEKYSPELADQAEYIVMNSKQGNQLPYALQEAAVASAVRNAGHDAVLGYSKGKNGPFLSELFDVRESHYPDRFGSSTVWDNLLSAEKP